jgi:hypothetical protein
MQKDAAAETVLAASFTQVGMHVTAYSGRLL